MQYAPTLPGKNSSGFWFVFIRGIKNRIGIGFIRPFAWSLVGRMQYVPTRVPEKMAIFLSVRPPVWSSVGRMLLRPTRTDENRAGFWFVFSRGIKNRIGIGFVRPLPWSSVGRIQYAPTRVPEKMAIFLSVQPLAWPSVRRMQYAPTRTDKNRAGFWFIFIR